MSAVPQPTTAQLVKAFADALAPLAGPYGLAADAVITAGLQFVSNVQQQRASGSEMVVLEAIGAKTTADLEALKTDVDALPS